MKKIIKNIALILFTAGLVAACEVEEFSDLNSPDLNDILRDPSVGDIQDLIGGMQSSMRTSLGTYFDDVGVIGREYYRFASSDPRFTADLLGRESAVLDNNTFYLTNPWAARYNVVKSANIVLQAVDITTASLSDQEKNAIRGFANTIKGYELLLNLNLTYQNGIRTDVADEKNLGPFRSFNESLQDIRSFLEEGASQLSSSSATFPFELSAGFQEFDTPEEFRKVNQALLARVAAYQGDLSGVNTFLGQSFFDLNGDLDTGAYYVFSRTGNDIVNPMVFQLNGTTAAARIVQPDFITDAEAGDLRLSKVFLRDNELPLDGLSGNYDFNLYESVSSPIAIIRNEELILLYAEAQHISNPGLAEQAINTIRNAAGLSDYSGALTPAALLDEILNQRRYSLYGEGHRWIDMRRFDRLDELPLDRAGDDVWVQFPIPLNENQ